MDPLQLPEPTTQGWGRHASLPRLGPLQQLEPPASRADDSRVGAPNSGCLCFIVDSFENLAEEIWAEGMCVLVIVHGSDGLAGNRESTLTLIIRGDWEIYRRPVYPWLMICCSYHTGAR